MKRLLATITAGGILLAPAAALANPAGWTAQLSSPFTSTSGKANTRNFNLSVSATSVNSTEILTVNVYQNNVLFGTFSDTSSTYGGSWNQPVAVPTDGDYTFKIVATNSNDDAASFVSDWIREFSAQLGGGKLIVICQEMGKIPTQSENVEFYSLGKEHGHGKLMQFLIFQSCYLVHI